MIAPIQTSLTRSITTRTGFVFHWPLPEVMHNTIRQVDTARPRLDSVKRQMNRWLQEGYRVRCPITGSVLSLYRRPLTKTHLGILVRLYAECLTKPSEWHHYRKFSRGHSDGDLAKMLYWGLVERSEDESLWRITDLGRRWLHGADTIPRHQAVFQGQCLGPWNDQDVIHPAEVDERFEMTALFGAA